MEEIEVKFLNVNIIELEEKLLKLGAVKQGEYFYRRKSYDFDNKSLSDKHAWVRLRDEGEKTVMTYKQRINTDDDNFKKGATKEVEIIVNDFATSDMFLNEIGLVEKFYEENTRVRYILDDVECDIDTWPLLAPYLEIEGTSWDKVEKVANLLGFDWNDHYRCPTMQIYELSGINENDYSILTFDKQTKKS